MKIPYAVRRLQSMPETWDIFTWLFDLISFFLKVFLFSVHFHLPGKRLICLFDGHYLKTICLGLSVTQELDLMIFLGPFQLRLFYDYKF